MWLEGRVVRVVVTGSQDWRCVWVTRGGRRTSSRTSMHRVVMPVLWLRVDVRMMVGLGMTVRTDGGPGVRVRTRTIIENRTIGTRTFELRVPQLNLTQEITDLSRAVSPIHLLRHVIRSASRCPSRGHENGTGRGCGGREDGRGRRAGGRVVMRVMADVG